ncbi:MAG: amino acid ABC transporter permease [Desulfovibrio sp.]|nr:amino acid ABC transporter permease [Desulfovibrio sp.]MBI4959189.1 amino acid ABC transporter permease [Desulfovibrio sp.]
MHWDVVWNNFGFFLWGAYPTGPLGGLAMSILMALGGIFGAFWLGLIIGVCRLSKRAALKYPAMVYIEIIRGTPLLMVIFWFYFLAPVLFGRSLPDWQSAILALIVFTSAYIAEIVRAGVLSLPKGQMEAARGSGLTHTQTMIHIILPQALFNMVPSFVNQFVSLTKDTSLAYIIGVGELTKAATQVNSRTMKAPFEIFLTVALLYFVICFVLTELSRRLETKINRYQARGR